MTVVLKSTPTHWIDDDYKRWRLKDGSMAGNAPGTWPRLLTHTIRRRPAGVPSIGHTMTHECRIKGKVGKGRIRTLRETKLFWIDQDGIKFRKNGDRQDGIWEKMVMSTLTEFKRVDGVRQPIKRTMGKHEVV